MKKLLLFTYIFIVSISVARAQGEMDAYNMSLQDLSGTARSIGMGGAFGALGGDITGVSINPAGIGVYKSSEFVTTMAFQNTHIENNDIVLGKSKESKFKFGFNNLAFVSVIPLDLDEMPFLNLGVSYNRLKSFDRRYTARGGSAHNSITDLMAYHATGYSQSQLEISRYNDPWSKNWLAVQGFNSQLIQNVGGTNYTSRLLPSYFIDNDLLVREKGSVSSYDFNIGTTISDMLSVGLTLSVTDLDYRLSSSFIEKAYPSGSDNNIAGLEQVNQLKTEGTGIQLAAGFIFKPIHELRIGVAYHSQTWYNMTDYFASELYHDLGGLQGLPSGYEDGSIISPENAYDYKLRTPDRWTFSAAGVIGNKAIISLDYELTNYKNMHLKDADDGDHSIARSGVNDYIKEDFRMASTVRVGVEFKPTNQFSIRAGYAFMQSPLQKSFKANEGEVMTSGTTSYYTLDGNTNHFTYGLGYRFTKNFYTDLAFVYKTQKSDLYNLATITDDEGDVILEGDRIAMKTNTFQTMLTLGFRF